MTTPRIRLSHRILTRTLEAAGLTTLPVPEPDEGILAHQAAWLDLGAEGVALMAGRRWPVATVQLEPPGRPATAVVRVHVAQLGGAGERDRQDLTADVSAISAGLLADLGFEVGA